MPASEEILNILRTTTNIELSLKTPINAFTVFMAAMVLIEDFSREESHQTKDNLDFLLSIMISVGRNNAVTRGLAIQLAMEMREVGISSSALEMVRITLFYHRPDQQDF